ncbi:protein MIS12 homolog isoform X2 [Actinidia eriantha]|uniref:protein MIS12 homolog isoform X2 n=1 Tax=Actinidia eriantha TaxID=165200 RepID=UPI00258AB73E|nr:protein MIS12 homolog isoform X2 [Actinidia eriantha]
MEGSECEAIFDSLKLNPQLFINAVLNSVDELVDDAFDFFHKQASTMLKIEGTDRSDGISKNESAGDSSMDIDILNDRELDAQLDSMRNKLALVEKETADLNREFQALERQSVLSNHCTGSINEALQLYEQHHVHAIFEELTKTALELSKKMEQLNAKSLEQSECIRRERMHIPDGDLFRVNHGNGLFNVALDELQAFITDMKNV